MPIFAALGSISFTVLNSPESFASQRGFEYAEHKVIEARPKLQALTRALEEITLDLGLHVSYCNPKAQMDALQALAQSFAAHSLVFGNGTHRGHFVITKLAETHRQLAGDGSFVAILIKVTLREWVRGLSASSQAALRPRMSAPPLPPPAVVHAAPGATPATWNPNQPIGPHNLLPTAAISQLSLAGAGPGTSYSPTAFSQPGISPAVNNPAATGASGPSVSYADVPLTSVTRTPTG